MGCYLSLRPGAATRLPGLLSRWAGLRRLVPTRPNPHLDLVMPARPPGDRSAHRVGCEQVVFCAPRAVVNQRRWHRALHLHNGLSRLHPKPAKVACQLRFLRLPWQRQRGGICLNRGACILPDREEKVMAPHPQVQVRLGLEDKPQHEVILVVYAGTPLQIPPADFPGRVLL